MQRRQPDQIAVLQRVSNTQVSLGPSLATVGGQQYSNPSTLLLSVGSNGALGLDIGAVSGNSLYYVYGVYVSGSLSIVASLSSIAPAGFLSSKLISAFYTDASAHIQQIVTSLNPAKTSWASGVITGAWNTNVTYNGLWRRDGDSMEADLQVLASGTPNAVTVLFFNVPGGLQMDVNKLANNNPGNRLVYGEGVVVSASAPQGQWYAFPVGNDAAGFQIAAFYLLVTASPNGAMGGVDTTHPQAWINNMFCNLRFRIPIVGWNTNLV